MESASGADEALTALARGGVIEELRASPGCVVWELGGDGGLSQRLAAQVEGLALVAIEAADAGESPADRHGPPALTILGAGAHAAGSSLEPWLERAHQLGCRYVYARRPSDGRAREEPVDRWYWRYDVCVAGGERLTLGEVRRAGAPGNQNRYRHTVGWRRLLPIAPRA